jgi:hypothetical protein
VASVSLTRMSRSRRSENFAWPHWPKLRDMDSSAPPASARQRQRCRAQPHGLQAYIRVGFLIANSDMLTLSVMPIYCSHRFYR